MYVPQFSDMKPLKDISTAHEGLILKSFCTTFPLTGFMGWLFLGIEGVLIAAAISFFVAVCSVFSAGNLGEIAGKLYEGREPIWTVEERYSADLCMARVQKMSKKHPKALEIIEKVLIEQPNYNEALFLKAQILVEGFDDTAGAKKCLAKIFQTEPKNTPLFKWSATLYSEITEND